MEIEREAKVIMIDQTCHHCGNEMKCTNRIEGPNYPHKCVKCGKEQTYKKTYPQIKYRPIKGSSQ